MIIFIYMKKCVYYQIRKFNKGGKYAQIVENNLKNNVIDKVQIELERKPKNLFNILLNMQYIYMFTLCKYIYKY